MFLCFVSIINRDMDFALIMDIVVLVIVFVSAAVAFLRGFVREVLTIVGLVGASLVALTAGPALSPGLENWLTADIPADEIEKARLWGYIPYDVAASAIAYLGLFVITLVVLSIISHYVAKSVHAIGLGPVDRSLGVVFGIARGFVLLGLLYLPFHILMSEEEKEDWFGTSHTVSYVEYSSDMMVALMPESWTRDTEAEEDIDPLKDLTGENDEKSVKGTDEEAAEGDEPAENTEGYDELERQAIDALINNQDRLKNMMRDRGANTNTTEEVETNESAVNE